MSRIVIVLTENYADWESALLSAALRTYYSAEVLTASAGGQPVTSAGGFRVTPDLALESLDPQAFDLLVLNGGSAWETEQAPDIGQLLKDVRAAGKPVAAICAATRALAAAGLLDAVPHTSNGADFLDGVAGYDGKAHYRDQPDAVSADGIITAPGTAPVSFMKKVCETLGFGGPELDFYTGLYAAEHRAA